MFIVNTFGYGPFGIGTGCIPYVVSVAIGSWAEMQLGQAWFQIELHDKRIHLKFTLPLPNQVPQRVYGFQMEKPIDLDGVFQSIINLIRLKK